jgi:hypothetical protein
MESDCSADWSKVDVAWQSLNNNTSATLNLDEQMDLARLVAEHADRGLFPTATQPDPSDRERAVYRFVLGREPPAPNAVPSAMDELVSGIDWSEW